MQYEATNKTAQENTDPHRSFRFQASINNTAISDLISRSQHFPRNLQGCFKGFWLLKLTTNVRKALTWHVLWFKVY